MWNQQYSRQIYHIDIMALKLDTPIQFEDLDQNQLNHLATSRLEYIGPWIDCLGRVSSRTKKCRPKNNKNCKQDENQSNQKSQFLSTLQRQIQFKRKRFRTMVQKGEPTQNQHKVQFKQLQNLSRKMIKRDEKQQSLYIDAFQKYEKQYENKQQGLNKNKKALSTTMYVYEYQQPRRTSRLSKKSKAVSFSQDTHKNHREQLSVQRNEKQFHNESKNLQRILKMKERIRIKNHYLVKKIKDKQLQSDKQTTQKYLQQLHTMKNWKSITLTNQKSQQKFEINQRKGFPHSNFKILDPDLYLKRTITSKYFD